MLGLMLYLRFRTTQAGFTAWIGQSLSKGPAQVFAVNYLLTLMLPFYVFSGLLGWGLILIWGGFFRRGWSRDWKAKEAFTLTLSALLWMHVVLWWQVPSALWTLPYLSRIPFWLLFPLLIAAALWAPLLWVFRQPLNAARRVAVLTGWLGLWTLIPIAPQQLPRLVSPPKGGDSKTEIVMVGFDGLRSDVGLQNTADWPGTAYRHAYTPIPATRLLWHILWGGDPLYYTVGHAVPDIEEFKGGNVGLKLLKEAKEKGWAPRFYIDDGGTIGLSGRSEDFDDVLMPARGWENFACSNLAANFPLFASWENWGRAYPTTNPWVPLDAGFKEALRLGRGSKWVMYHSCLAHQPIYLRRDELSQIARWWTLSPSKLEPIAIREFVTDKTDATWDDRYNPFLAYKLRAASVLKAWRPLWVNLAQDPDYTNATRILFSDHGERFYHVTDKVQLMGIHGFGLDPWETRAMLLIDGHQFRETDKKKPNDATVSLLDLRRVIEARVMRGRPISPENLISGSPAPIRYHTLNVDHFTDSLPIYKEMATESLKEGTYIAPDGLWFMRYESTIEERAEEVSVALGDGAKLTVYKHVFEYNDYVPTSQTIISEEAFKKVKQHIEQLMKESTRLN
jgi:hypothetical protein